MNRTEYTFELTTSPEFSPCINGIGGDMAFKSESFTLNDLLDEVSWETTPHPDISYIGTSVSGSQYEMMEEICNKTIKK